MNSGWILKIPENGSVSSEEATGRQRSGRFFKRCTRCYFNGWTPHMCILVNKVWCCDQSGRTSKGMVRPGRFKSAIEPQRQQSQEMQNSTGFMMKVRTHVKIEMTEHSAESRSVRDRLTTASETKPRLVSHLSSHFHTVVFLLSLSSLKTACPHSPYRPSKLDRGFPALCFSKIQSWFSVSHSASKGVQRRQFIDQTIRVAF